MLLLIFLLWPQSSKADVFSKSVNQENFDIAVKEDKTNFYYRSPFDYNAFSESHTFEFDKYVNLGINNYDMNKSLRNIMNGYEFNNMDFTSNGLLTLSYSSPAMADLYKHLETVGYLRLAIRYQQYQNIENSLVSSTIKLQKQAILDCLNRKNSTKEIDKALEGCIDYFDLEAKNSFYQLYDPYDPNENPYNRNFITSKIDVTEKVLDKVNTERKDISEVKEIVPRILIDRNSIYFKTPHKKSRELMAQYKYDLLGDEHNEGDLIRLLNYYKTHKQMPILNQANGFDKIEVFGVPFTEGQIKNLLLLDMNSQTLALNQIGSNIAYLRAIDQFLLASEMFNKVMSDPGIEQGYKSVLQSSMEYVHKEILDLKEERERLSLYAETMRNIVSESDNVRYKAMTQIQKESKYQKVKGLFKLNP